jgi:hypothetical protein
VANFSFNVALGREVEFYSRVDGNDPANSAFTLVVLANAGLESDDLLRDYDTLAALLAGASSEVTNTGYGARKEITDAQLAAYVVDDTLDQITLQFPSQTYTTIGVGDLWRKLLICYDSDTTGGTDANIIPVKAFDMLIDGAAVIPNGNNILAAWPEGFHVAR